MTEFSIQFAYQQGFDDAIHGRPNAKFMFASAREHDDYVLGFKAGVVQALASQTKQQKQARQQLRSQPPAQGEFFRGEERE